MFHVLSIQYLFSAQNSVPEQNAEAEETQRGVEQMQAVEEGLDGDVSEVVFLQPYQVQNKQRDIGKGGFIENQIYRVNLRKITQSLFYAK